MGFRAKNDRKRLAALTSVKARDGCEAVLALNPTEGAANLGQLFPTAPCKPVGLLRISRKNLISKFSRVKYPSVYEFTACIRTMKATDRQRKGCKSVDETETGSTT
jgi:hypothetical protein